MLSVSNRETLFRQNYCTCPDLRKDKAFLRSNNVTANQTNITTPSSSGKYVAGSVSKALSIFAIQSEISILSKVSP